MSEESKDTKPKTLDRSNQQKVKVVLKKPLTCGGVRYIEGDDLEVFPDQRDRLKSTDMIK